ncbi:MAG: hypothetical protein AAGC92_03615 [Pseudomonadota bacterium]
MYEKFATIPVSNSRLLCIGGVTRAEAKEARAAGVDIDGSGFYLFLASESEPQAPIEVLASFFSAEHAERTADIFPSAD